MTVEYPESVDLVVIGTGLVQAIISWYEHAVSCVDDHEQLTCFMHS